MANSDYNVM